MPSRRRAFTHALFALLVGVLAYLFGVGSALGQRAESNVLEASSFDPDPAGPLRLVSTSNLVLALVVIGLIALWVHGVRRSLSVLATSLIALVVSQVLKDYWLWRPELLDSAAQNTFPSGHMTVYTVVVGALLWALPFGWRWVVMPLGSVLLGVVSWQLLEYGWHRPSDLVGAQALTVLTFAVAAWIGPRGSRRTSRRPGAFDSEFDGAFAGAKPGRAAVTAAAPRIMSAFALVAGAVLLVGAVALVAVSSAMQNNDLLLRSGDFALIGVGVLTARTLTRLCP